MRKTVCAVLAAAALGAPFATLGATVTVADGDDPPAATSTETGTSTGTGTGGGDYDYTSDELWELHTGGIGLRA